MSLSPARAPNRGELSRLTLGLATALMLTRTLA
jgi:hypothetical protein